jgi:CRISPR/Cas system-associated protein Cas10 (large subunit of type III CRISPR-Cas system)
MSADQAREIAERIAKRVSGRASEARGSVNTDIGSELAAMRATLNELQNRLIQIESKVSSSGPTTPRVQSPWLAGVNASHASMERFGVEEATVSELVDFFQNEKACSLEPGGKPCDHCAMCSSRGF